MTEQDPKNMIELDLGVPVWERCFTVAPLVLIGTTEENGSPDLAPKHMVTPMGWDNYFGFVCTPRHGTYHNVQRTGVFTVSYPRPSQLLYTSLAAAPRCEDGQKNSLDALPMAPATKIDGVFIEDAYLVFECEHMQTLDGYGVNSLITGRIVAARANVAALRAGDGEDAMLIRSAPLLAYLSPGRFASITDSFTYPFPAGMSR